MEEKVTIPLRGRYANAGIEIPREDWEQTPTSVKEVVKHLERRLTSIEERLGLTSKNSSMPPSSDPPKGKKDSQEKKKRGGQKGHKGFGRTLYDTTRVSVEKWWLTNPNTAGTARQRSVEKTRLPIDIKLSKFPQSNSISSNINYTR